MNVSPAVAETVLDTLHDDMLAALETAVNVLQAVYGEYVINHFAILTRAPFECGVCARLPNDQLCDVHRRDQELLTALRQGRAALKRAKGEHERQH